MSPILRSIRSKQLWKCRWTWLQVFMHRVEVILHIEESIKSSKCLGLHSVLLIPAGGVAFNRSVIVLLKSFFISDFITLQHSSIGLRGALYGASRSNCAPSNSFSSITSWRETCTGALSHTTTTTSWIGSSHSRRSFRSHSQQSYFRNDPRRLSH